MVDAIFSDSELYSGLYPELYPEQLLCSEVPAVALKLEPAQPTLIPSLSVQPVREKVIDKRLIDKQFSAKSQVKLRGRSRWWLLGLLGLAGLGLLLASRRKHGTSTGEIKTARGLHLVRLAGDWYEIARLPGQVDRQAVGLQVTFEIQDPQHLELEYSWQAQGFASPRQSERRSLFVPDPQQPAKMKKQLMGDLEFDYWILEADWHYDYLVIGTPSRQHLWILSRRPQLSEGTYQGIVRRVQQQGFETALLIRVPQLQPQEQRV
ncbi:MAG: lipocalin family protein [Candidatus Sericytochromatia bacterium]